jgi:hypothetical protein
MAGVVFLPLYILHAHEKHTGIHTLLNTETYEVQLHLRGMATPTATPIWYCVTYEVQLHLISTATPDKYSYSYKVKLHLQESAH